MKVGNKYKLNLGIDEFFQKTWKNEFCLFLREHGGFCSPDRVESGEHFDTAYFNNGSSQLELASDMWKYFIVADADDTQSTQLADMQSLVVNNKISNFVTPKAVSDNLSADNLSIDFDIAQNLKRIEVGVENSTDQNQLLKFAVDHVFRTGSKYQLSEITDTDLMVSQIIELEKLDRTISALENVASLVDNELERVRGLVIDRSR